MKILVALFIVGCVMSEEILLKKFSDGNIKFSAQVYHELRNTSAGSFLASPLSVQTVFALLHAGTGGSTSSQIASGLNFPKSSQDIQNTFKKLLPVLQHTGAYNLSSANKIYIKNQFKIKNEFNDVAKETFKSDTQEIDFNDVASAVNEINEWVKEQTDGTIQELLAESDIDPITILVLINAMYFKGNWVNRFNKDDTRTQPFFVNKNDQVEVYTMEITNHFKYYECNQLNVKFLEMDFEGGDVSMTFVLPNEKEGLASVEENLETIFKTPNYTTEKVHVKLPKYKIETKIQFRPILEKVGIIDVFDDDKADLSGISSDFGDKLSVTKVIQKAFIEVDEDGTTAAAATAGVVIFTSTHVEPKEFNADHPFIFILKHKYGIMFVGRYNGQ